MDRCRKEFLAMSGFGYFVSLIKRSCFIGDNLLITWFDPEVIGVWSDGELTVLDYDWEVSYVDYERNLLTLIIRVGVRDVVIRIRGNRIIDVFSMDTR
ncbi:MAG: hypothetical protein ACP5GY_05310 [Vulcanisaeta sp.]